ncbi:MAG: hypothetical protein C4527_10505 [Candidatus Omnitrophota bacterium]|nr:MAG: hypothetical protein C4527_10505 [Candidatus Omnitrophota bacterium]
MMNKNVWVWCICVGFGLFAVMGADAQGLLGFWQFDEGSGDVVADSSGNGNNATVFNVDAGLGENGSVWVNDPERGSVISFGGGAGGAYVLAGDGLIPVMSFDQNFTWVFWAKQGEGNGSNNIVFGNRMNITPADFVPRQFIKFTPTKFEWHMNGNGNDNLEYDDIPNGVWLHHAVVKRGNIVTYYRNGVMGGSRIITQELSKAQPLFFGGDNEGASGENWIGYMDNARIYNVALSTQAIVNLFVQESVSVSTVGYWDFDEGSGDVVHDSSGNGNDGTVFNVNAGLGENGSVWVNDPERGSVISFAGGATGAYVLAGDGLIPVMAFDQDFTWAFWAKQGEGNGSNNIVIGNRMNITPADFVPRQFIKFTPTKFEWHMNGNGNDNMEYEDIPNGIWLFHTVVKKGDQLTYYRNGVMGGSKVITQALAEPQPLFFGGDNEGASGENWIGYMDNARVYKAALDPMQIMTIFMYEIAGVSGVEWAQDYR